MYNKTKRRTIAKKDYSFSVAYSRLDKENKEKVKKEICNRLQISEHSFTIKKLAYFNITAVDAEIIREIFGKHGIKRVFNYEYAD